MATTTEYVHTADNCIHLAACPKAEGKKLREITTQQAIITLNNRAAYACGCLIAISAEEEVADEQIQFCANPVHINLKKCCTSIGYARGYITRNYQQFMDYGHVYN